MPRALALVGVLALVAIGMSGWPLWLRVVVIGAVLAGVLRAAIRWTRGRVLKIACDVAGQWRLHRQGEGEVAAVLAGFRVLGPCILLRFRVAEHGEQTLLLAPDNSDADLRRRLRMRLAALDLTAALPRI